LSLRALRARVPIVTLKLLKLPQLLHTARLVCLRDKRKPPLSVVQAKFVSDELVGELRGVRDGNHGGVFLGAASATRPRSCHRVIERPPEEHNEGTTECSG
jgi:hypothetical protein